MKHHFPSYPSPLGPSELEQLLSQTAAKRREAVAAILAGQPVPEAIPDELTQARDVLEEAEDRDGLTELRLDEGEILRLDLTEETTQLENDVLYLEEGREALFKHLAKHRHGFRDAVRRALRELAPVNAKLLLCQAEAIFCAPGQGWLTAVQPAWNAVSLGRFAAARAKQAVLWSAAPLTGSGLADRCALPPRSVTLAASLGRQIVDSAGRVTDWPLPAQKTALLTAINARLALLMTEPDWRAFAYVGSGLQFRHGETVVARQDGRERIDEDTSLDLLEHIHDIVDAVDPEREHFLVEDDGLDVYVTPRGNGKAGQDFGPAEGLAALAAALELDPAQGPHLACCGGPSGLELLEALVARCDAVHCLFVTDREELGAKARDLCPRTAVVAHPDIAAAVFSAAAP